MFHPLHLVRDGGADALGFEYTIVDVETTGLDPRRGHRVCEIAVVRVRGDGEVVEEFSSMVNPGRRIPREVAEYHGIGDADVAGAPSFGQLAGTLLRMARGAVVVAHTPLRGGVPGRGVRPPGSAAAGVSRTLHGDRLPFPAGLARVPALRFGQKPLR